MATAVDQDSDLDSWVHIDSDNPANSSGDDAGVLSLSSGCTTPNYRSDDDEDEGLGFDVVLSSSTILRQRRRDRSPSPPPFPFPLDDDDDDVEGIYDPAEEEVVTYKQPPPPADSRPLSGLFHHMLDGVVDYVAFDPVLGSTDSKVLIPDPAFTACKEEVTVLASTGGLVCLFARDTGVYIVANPATYKRVRLPPHSCNHYAYGNPAVVITFEEKAERACCADHRGHYHVVVAFPLEDGVYAYESFSSRTWKWTPGAAVSAVEHVVSASGVGTLGRAFWRTALGYFLCYDPELGVAELMPAPLEVLQWPCWELGEMNGTLSVTCMDERVNEVVVIIFDRDPDDGAVSWSLAAHFEGGCMRNRDGVYLLRSQGYEVVMWYPLLELAVAMDAEGRTTRTIGPLTDRKYYSDFIPFVASTTEINGIDAGAECKLADANADEA